ncbi:MAG: ChbG/HpnK family deacetylase [Candidatus Moraniibacteriota bacterium]
MFNEKISVVIPCFNEEKTIAANIQKIHTYLKEHFHSFEIIAVDDGSTDNTKDQINLLTGEIPLKLIATTQNTGKGHAVKSGILSASPDSFAVMFLDADLAIPIEETAKFFTALKSQKLDIVIASRFVPGLKIVEPVLWYRKIMEIIFRFLRSIILNDWQVKDSQCGFKVFRRSVALKIFKLTNISRFAFDSEVIYLAKKFSFTIRELPITLCNPQKSHIRIVKDSLNMFFALFKIRYNSFRGIYHYNLAQDTSELIFSADDFGASQKTNRRILKLVQAGKINRVAVMINRDLSKKDIKLLKKSGVTLDLHLELFIDKKLKLKGSAWGRGLAFYFGYLRGDFQPTRIKRIWAEQIQKFEEVFNQKPAGLNSHEHFHLFPPFFRIVCLLAQKNNIRYVRLGKKKSPLTFNLTNYILRKFNKKNNRLFFNYSRLATSRHLISLDWVINKKNPLQSVPAQTELVCHPQRKSEYKFLKKLTS